CSSDLCVAPSGSDADQHDKRHKDFPVAFNRLSGEGRIRDPKNRQGQHQAEGQLLQPKVRTVRLGWRQRLRNRVAHGRRSWLNGDIEDCIFSSFAGTFVVVSAMTRTLIGSLLNYPDYFDAGQIGYRA